MSAEISDVVLDFDGVILAHAEKVSIKKKKDSSNKTTFDGDVTFGSNSTGGTISIDTIYWPKSITDAINLENKLEDNSLDYIKCIAYGYTTEGEKYKRTIEGLEPKISDDSEDWSPTDGISNGLELTCKTVNKKTEKA